MNSTRCDPGEDGNGWEWADDLDTSDDSDDDDVDLWDDEGGDGE